MLVLVIALHLLFVLFMLAGFVLTVDGVLRRSSFMGWRMFRSLHLLGIVGVCVFLLLGDPCPLTDWEEQLRTARGMGSPIGTFLVHYLEKTVYPDMPPVLIIIPTYLIALLTFGIYLARPPWRENRDRRLPDQARRS